MKNVIISIVLFFTLGISAIAQVEFTARAKSAVLVGEKFQLMYSVNKESDDLVLAPLDNFTVLMGPSVMSSSSTQIINGKVTRSQSYTYTYILKANKAGKYTINPAQVTVDGKKYQSNTVNIEVVENQASMPQTQSNSGTGTDSNDASANSYSKDDLFIRVVQNKSSVYPGEPLVLTTKIYTRMNLDNISDIKHPDFRNFIVQDIDKKNIEWSYEFVNNKQYQVGTFEQKVLYAQKEGTQTIEPTEIEFLIKQRVNRRSNSIFDDFFNDNYRTVKKRVKSKPITIKVKSFPSGKPANFDGLVGDLSMKVTASQNKAKVDDGITIKVVVSGTGNHKMMTTPKLNIPPDFDPFDPTVDNQFTNTTAGMKGSKTFEYLIIPRHEGSFSIPAIELSFFNPKTKKFQTLKSDPIAIEVEKNPNSTSSSTSVTGNYRPNTNREDIKFVGKDIRYIKTGKTRLQAVGTFIFGSLPFVLAYIIPLLLLGIALLINKKRMHENANVHLVKNKKANKMATKRLKKAASLLKEGDHESFYDEILKANYAYLSDKLFLPVSELSKDKAKELLTKKGVSDDMVNDLLEVIDTCEFARFSPSSGEGSEMDKLYKKAIVTITNLDDQIRK